MSGEPNEEHLDYGILPNLIGYKLRRAQIKFFDSFARNFDEFNITPGLFAIIELVNKNPGMSQSTIAAGLQNDRSTMVHAVDKLEKMHIIKREPSPTDRRSNVLYMTAQGQIVYEALVARVFQHEQEFHPLLAEGEIEQLLSILSKISKD